MYGVGDERGVYVSASHDQLGHDNSGHDQTSLIGGLLLILAASAALIAANSPLAESYHHILNIPLAVTFDGAGFTKPLHHWVNDGLMAIFFLLVGLEIKREALIGDLNSFDKAILPLIGATGGFLLPALIYVAVNWDNATNLRGWAIPTATDIAFALGVASLLGKRVPLSLKAFLLALATIDDLMAIIVIAIFYTSELSLLSLILASVGLLALYTLNRRNVHDAGPYVLAGLFTWACVLKSGVHATLAGVAIGMAMPLTGQAAGAPLLDRVEHALKPWVAFLIVPLFAFANAGVPFDGVSPSSLLDPLPLGIIMGLVIGKALGVFGASWLAIRTGFARMPKGADHSTLFATAMLAGIGFTMSLFIGTLAFPSGSEIALLRLGVLAGSMVSALAAVALFVMAHKPTD
jgi:Na+:H+ antiporter, NhaA family